MTNRQLLIIGGVAVLGIAGFIVYKRYATKQAVAGNRPVPTNQAATGTNTQAPGSLSQWEQTIGGLYQNISSIFTGNSNSNTNNPAPTGQVAATGDNSQINDLSAFM